MKKAFTFILLLNLYLLPAQEGCTDDQALNYDMSALTNDGSCIYPATNYNLSSIAILPELLNESSGLAFFDGGLWTHNDGGVDEIYKIDQATGEIIQSVLIANSNNKDWEDFAEDNEYLYIGDFGNNGGDRTNLRVYRVEKNSLGGLIANAEKIEFSYIDQTDFTENHNNNDYDCEAFFYHNDSLHLFTKNWVDNKTRHYTVPTIPGVHVAQLRDSLDVNGLITAADIGSDGVISLLGYTEIGLNFMWLLYDYQDQHYFSGNKRRIDLGTALTNSQTEGITFTQNGEGFVSAENFNTLPPRLLSFTTRQWTEDFISSNKEVASPVSFELFPNPFSSELSIQFSAPIQNQSELILFNSLGQAIKTMGIEQGSSQVQLNIGNALINGWYWIQVSDGKQIYQKKILKMD